MTAKSSIDLATFLKYEEIMRIGRRAVHKAQEESRRRGVPNVYSINGLLYYELPSGELCGPIRTRNGKKTHKETRQLPRGATRCGSVQNAVSVLKTSLTPAGTAEPPRTVLKILVFVRSILKKRHLSSRCHVRHRT